MTRGVVPDWIVGATLIDGTGADPIDGAAIEMVDGSIRSIGRTPPADAAVLDGAGLTVTPGLIDAHAHLAISIGSISGDGVSLAEHAASAFEVCGIALDAGFTTVRDVGGADIGLASVIASGRVRGPRMLPSGPAIIQTGGHGHFGSPWACVAEHDRQDLPGLYSNALLSDGADAVRRNVREAFRRGATQIKLAVTGGVISQHDRISDTQLTVAEIASAVAEANARDSYVTAHAHNNEGVRNAVLGGVKCIEHASWLDESTAELMAEHDVALVPTLLVLRLLADRGLMTSGMPPSTAARAAEVADRQPEAVRIARAAGLLIGLGSDLVGPQQSGRGRELILRAEVEDPMTALLSATRDNARILRIDHETGTVEPGKRADLTLFEGDPLADTSLFDRPDRIPYVVQQGRLVKTAA